MDYLADTVAFVRFSEGSKNIGKSALDIMLSANSTEGSHIALSTISLMEIMYSAEKKRISIELLETIGKLSKHPNFSIIDLDVNIIKVASTIHGLELHDRMIVATAKYLKVPLITCDKAIIASNFVRTIWS